MSYLRYVLERAVKNWKNTKAWKNLIIESSLYVLFRNNGQYIYKENWDHLIILDACRYDIFEKEIMKWGIPGKLEYRISRGANTPAFLIENFGNGNFRDVVYIAANPYSNLVKDNFYKTIPVWDFGWNVELSTVPPEIVYEATVKAITKYRGKRFIIHFMQPHHPFLKLKFTCKLKGTNAWTLMKKGKISKDLVTWAYTENLRIVMPYLKKLLKILWGKVVITSDHGNAVGEKLHPLIPKRVYGHSYAYIRIEPLVKVPWFVTEGDGDHKVIENELIRLKVKKLQLGGK